MVKSIRDKGEIVMEKNEVLCHCFNVTVGDVLEAIENGAETFEEVQEATQLGNGCGSCIESAQEIVEELLDK